jgi:glycosyltransferase involved in cell wall biosynthesis
VVKLSVIIPVYNGGERFAKTLRLLVSSQRAPDEIIVIDDASTDGSVMFACISRVRVVRLEPPPHGPAYARNQGAALATGDILVFLDSDVAVHPDTLMLIEKYFTEQPDLAALFGSYDDYPTMRNFASLYKNLLHSYTHQNSKRDSSSFWAGCGAIRLKVFKSMNGFDEKFSNPSIEDIELGSRLSCAGFKVWLCHDIKVTHLKKWTLGSMLTSDILYRAIPWSRLIVHNGHLPNDMNVNIKSRWSAVFAWILVLAIIPCFWSKWFLLGLTAVFLATLVLNFPLFKYFMQYGGIFFAPVAYCLHQFYLLYSSSVFAVIYFREKFKKRHAAADF